MLHFLCCILKALFVKEHDVDRFRVERVISVLNTVCIDSRHQYSSKVYPRIKCLVGGSGTPVQVLHILQTLAALYN